MALSPRFEHVRIILCGARDLHGSEPEHCITIRTSERKFEIEVYCTVTERA